MGKKKSKIKKKVDKANDEHRAKLSRNDYEAKLFKLHAELIKLQNWVTEKGLKIVVIFEGRDAAGKGGVIKRITERVSPRVFRVEALPAPTEREKTQMYGQRYIRRFPAAGEVVLFDRSWYNRAGVERVMKFCTKDQYERFLKETPMFERWMVESDIQLIKYWFDISMEEQKRRFQDRIDDPRKIWKLSPMDMQSYKRWYDYSRARDDMLAATSTGWAPWHIVHGDNKRRARLNCISHLLSLIPYKKLPLEKIELGKRDMKGKYNDQKSIAQFRFIPEKY
ncbi:MAG: polyphosphate kinase 2 [Proteobacteria bacterium]|nr:polyphosphate kinase 2 [Pseudomonadota bacterium]